MRKALFMISRILFNVVAFVFGIAVLFSIVCSNATIESMITNNLFPPKDPVVVNTGKAPIRYKTWYSSVNDVLNGNDAVAAAAQAEGTVLLKNDNVLPLSAGDKVSVFGVNAYSPIYSLNGAGRVKVNTDRMQYFADEFADAGLDVNTELADWYNSNEVRTNYWRGNEVNSYWDGADGNNAKNVSLKGAPWSAVNASGAVPTTGGGTAVFVTGRITNEAIDIMPSNVGGLGAKNNDYLKLTDNELSVLQGLKDAKDAHAFDNIVLIINQATGISEDLPEVMETYGIDACLWIGYPGSAGLTAVAKIMTGEANPSGKLPDMWYTSANAHPAYKHYAEWSNVIMQEGMYLGYRYAETRYEDYVRGRANTGNYIYGDNVSFPFGYGLSYTTFDYEFVSLSQDPDPDKNYERYTDDDGNRIAVPAAEKRADGDDLIAEVKVTNSGDRAGKGVVQIYVQKPYTTDDVADGVEEPSVELVGFGKTSKLGEGQSETVQVKIDVNKLFASYNITENKYTVNAGDYLVAVGDGSHDALNNILAAKGNTPANTDNRMDGEGNASLVKTVEISSEYARNYKYWTLGGAEVTNLFDHSDPNKASGDANYVKFMSRSDWTGTADISKQTISLKGDMSKGQTVSGYGKQIDNNVGREYYPEVYEEFGDEYPTYAKNREKNADGTYGNAEITLAEMVGVEYRDDMGATEEDKQKWEDFMDQLTWDETRSLVSSGQRITVALSAIAKPHTNDVNASNAIIWKFDMGLNSVTANRSVGFSYHFDGANRNYFPTGYPCEGIIAATFNVDIAYAVGQAIGEDALWSGASGLYGFGLGQHRSPYHGRAGEYYSEDPFLSGIMGGWESKGAQSKGLYVYNKHFVLNDQETNRTGHNTWLTEQTMREIYLRSFELAIEIGDAMNVMNAFNNIGTYWSGVDYNLMTKWLRGEAGMRGFAITDWYPTYSMNITYGILAGTDLPDGSDNISKYGPDADGKGDYGAYAHAVRRSAQRQLYTVANSNAMNFIGEDTIIITYESAWTYIRDDIIDGITIAFMAVTALLCITSGWVYVSDILEAKRRLGGK